MNNIYIELDVVWKPGKAKGEGRYINRASVTYEDQYYESTGDYDNIQALLRSVPWLEAHFSTLVDVKRSGTRVFELVALKAWLFPVKKEVPKGFASYNKKKGLK